MVCLAMKNSSHGQQNSAPVLFAGVAADEVTVTTSELLIEAKKKVDFFSFSSVDVCCRWGKNSCYCMCLSAESNKAVQRTLVFPYAGSAEFFVHCKRVATDQFLVN